MVEERKTVYRRSRVCVRIASVMLALVFTVMSVSPGFALTEDVKKQEKPLREVHKVGIENSLYCFFVQQNVVLTPEEILDKTSEELNEYILEKSGLYIKESNCRLEKHKAIPIGKWKKKDAVIFLSANNLENIRAAEPVDGAPVKMYMDLLISSEAGYAAEMEAAEKSQEAAEEVIPAEDTDTGNTGDTVNTEDAVSTGDTVNTEDAGDAADTEDSEEPAEEVPVPYSTYKLISPELIFVAVATEADAASGEDICKEKTPSNNNKNKRSSGGRGEPSEDEMLPEYRTINMVDRSGPPVEETLKDGDPVTLEWIEPKHKGVEGDASFTDRIPGGKAGILAMAAAVVAAAGAAVFAIKRRKTDE